MKIEIVNFVDGARNAEGIAVVIDVYRAFSVACYCFSKGVSKIYPVGDVDDSYNLVKKFDGGILIGERKGQKLPGFDYGNSPTEILAANLLGKTVVHTTHAGTQGIVNCIDPIGYGLSKFDKLYHARQVMKGLLSTGKRS